MRYSAVALRDWWTPHASATRGTATPKSEAARLQSDARRLHWVTMLPTPLIRKEPPSTRITHVPAGTFRRRRDGGVCMAAVHAVDTVQVRDHPQLPRVVKSRRGYPIYSLLSNTLRYQLSRARPTPSQHSCRTARHACTSSPNWLLSRFWRRRWAATPPQSSGTPSTRPPSTLAMSPPSALNSSVCATRSRGSHYRLSGEVTVHGDADAFLAHLDALADEPSGG